MHTACTLRCTATTHRSHRERTAQQGGLGYATGTWHKLRTARTAHHASCALPDLAAQGPCIPVRILRPYHQGLPCSRSTHMINPLGALRTHGRNHTPLCPLPALPFAAG